MAPAAAATTAAGGVNNSISVCISEVHQSVMLEGCSCWPQSAGIPARNAMAPWADICKPVQHAPHIKCCNTITAASRLHLQRHLTAALLWLQTNYQPPTTWVQMWGSCATGHFGPYSGGPPILLPLQQHLLPIAAAFAPIAAALYSTDTP